MTIAYLGPEGSYTDEAARRIEPNAPRTPMPTIEDVFAAVASGETERGLVPHENVIQGPVTETLDNLYRYADDVHIIDMHLMPIEHALGTMQPHLPLTRVYSKDQALKQCSEYLRQHCGDAERIETASTAKAVQTIVEEGLEDAGAIASEEALVRYGLHVIARNIGNVRHNKTRFALLAPRQATGMNVAGPAATQVVVYPHHDRVGLLDDLLTVISHRHGLNLSAIHSRPDTRGGFRFYLEIEGHQNEPRVQDCLDELKRDIGSDDIEVRMFGSYPACPFAARTIRTIGILGGTGKMGGWFNTLFRQAGYDVLLSGRRTPLTYEDCIDRSDVVLVNVPISHTLEVIERIGPMLLPGQLLVDNTSIKTQPVEAMLQAAPEDVEVLGMHTVFGPQIDALKGQNVIFTRTERSTARAQEFENIFFKYGAKITHTTPAHHDKQMALHQNLEHFTKGASAHVVRRHFENFDELDAYSSPNSRASLATMGRILSGDPQLYTEIQRFNTQGAALVQDFAEAATMLAESISEGSLDAFADDMEKSAQELGEVFLRKAVEASKRSGR